MKKAEYENRIFRPLLYIRLLASAVLVFNLSLPLVNEDMGFKIIGQYLICILCLWTLVGAQGGLGTLFFTKNQPLPVNLWVIVRFLEILIIWLRYGWGSFEIYFWFVIALDILFIIIVDRDYKKYAWEE